MIADYLVAFETLSCAVFAKAGMLPGMLRSKRFVSKQKKGL